MSMPTPGLRPIPSSTTPDVTNALSRRASRRHDVYEAHEAGREDALRFAFESPDDVVQAPAPSLVQRDVRRVWSQTTTLGQLVEEVRQRKARQRTVVESGDPDGGALDHPPVGLLAQLLARHQQ